MESRMEGERFSTDSFPQRLYMVFRRVIIVISFLRNDNHLEPQDDFGFMKGEIRK